MPFIVSLNLPRVHLGTGGRAPPSAAEIVRANAFMPPLYPPVTCTPLLTPQSLARALWDGGLTPLKKTLTPHQ